MTDCNARFQSLNRSLVDQRRRHFWLLPLLLIIFGFTGNEAFAQLLFNTQTPIGERLIQRNGDGTTSGIQISDLPQAANPAVSGNGRFLAVRSSFPNRPNLFSTNVFVFDAVNGTTRQITQFNQDTQDPQTGATFNHTPRYSALSPDGQFIVVSDFLNTQTAQGSLTTSFSSIYRVSDGELLIGPSILSQTELAGDTIGDGVSWSSATNEVAIPSGIPVPGTPLVPTAIIVGNGLFGLPVRQLTFPSVFANGAIQHDFFPQFSPNGQALAYFRSLSQTGLPSQVSLRITSAGGDRSITGFNPGSYPIGLTWSPDGSQLAFGLGTQISGSGIFLNRGDPNSSEIFTINADGSGINRILTAPAHSPTWSSGVPGGEPVIRGDVNSDGAVNFLDISPFISILSTGSFQAEADINQDTEVDFLDISPFIGLLSSQ